jgi:hypothetical protein
MASGDILLDLVNQDHGIAHDDPGEGDRAQQRDEPERLAEDQQRKRDADQPQRSRQDHHQRTREAPQLDHQERQHGQQKHGKAGGNRLLATRRILDRATLLDPVSQRQRCANLVELRGQAICHIGPCASPLTSARTVIVGRRSRRHMIPSSCS